ncbi:MAG: hypothetical protein ACJATT_003690 [Myxococcota bacterium]|jgi:hypothetical protein
MVVLDSELGSLGTTTQVGDETIQRDASETPQYRIQEGLRQARDTEELQIQRPVHLRAVARFAKANGGGGAAALGGGVENDQVRGIEGGDSILHRHGLSQEAGQASRSPRSRSWSVWRRGFLRRVRTLSKPTACSQAALHGDGRLFQLRLRPHRSGQRCRTRRNRVAMPGT